MPPNTSESDQELVAGCLAGDQRAWNALCLRYGPPLEQAIRHTLIRIGAPSADLQVEDALQETFLELIANDAASLRSFQWECSLRTYLTAIAIRSALRPFRRHPGLQRLEGEGLAFLAEAVADPAAEAPSARLAASESHDALAKALSSLSARERLALKLFYWDSVPAEAIGKMLRLERGSGARSVLSRARQRLGEILKNRLCL